MISKNMKKKCSRALAMLIASAMMVSPCTGTVYAGEGDFTDLEGFQSDVSDFGSESGEEISESAETDPKSEAAEDEKVQAGEDLTNAASKENAQTEENPAKEEDTALPVGASYGKEAPVLTVKGERNAVELTWTYDGSCDSYVIYRSTNGRRETKLGEVNWRETKYSDTQIYQGEVYTYTVCAVNDFVESPESDAAEYVWLDTPDVTAENGSDGVELTWDKIDGAAAYKIYRGEYSWDLSEYGETEDLFFVDEEAVSGKYYTYRVKAVRGQWECEEETQITDYRYLAAPVIEAESTSGGIVITWNKVRGAEAYEVYREGGGRVRKMLADLDSSQLTYTDETIQSGVSYTYTVKAANWDGKSGFSRGKTVRYLTAPAVKASNESDGVKLTWEQVTGASEYRIYRRTDADSWTLQTIQAENTYTDTTAVSGTAYEYIVKAADGDSLSGEDAAAKIIYLSIPEVSTESADKGITVSWNPVSGASAYQVYRRTEKGDWTSLKKVTATSYADTTAKSGVLYYYTVYAVNGKNKSAGVTDHTHEYLSPAAITVASNLKSITLKWAKVGGAQGYYVYRSTSKTKGFKKAATLKSGTVSYTDKKAVKGKIYYYRVIPYKGTLQASYTPVAAKLAPAAPVISSTVNVTSNSVKLTWSKVSGVNGYEVYRKSGSGKFVKIATLNSASTVSYTDSKASGTLSYKLVSFVKSGSSKTKSLDSEIVSTKTLKKTKISTSGYNNEVAFMVSWKKISGASGYQIYRKKGEKGKWSKLTTISGNSTLSYVDKTIINGTYFYYKVRPYYKSGDYKSYGAFSADEGRLYYYNPNYQIYISDRTQANAKVLALLVRNKGKGYMRVYGSGAKMVDNDTRVFDRRLELVTSNLEKISYVDIAPGSSAYVNFNILGDSTWYDKKTDIIFKFSYDSIDYTNRFSDYYGVRYTKN